MNEENETLAMNPDSMETSVIAGATAGSSLDAALDSKADKSEIVRLDAALEAHNDSATAHPDIRAHISNTVTDALSCHNSNANAHSDLRNRVDSKVDKVTGMGLSSNDYTAEEKANQILNTSARHIHNNKVLLDGVTSTMVNGWDSATSHIADGVKHVTATERTGWNAKADQSYVDTEMQNKANYISHGLTPTDMLSVLGDGTHKCWAWTNTPSNFIDGQAYVTAKDWALKDGVVAYGRRNCSSPYGGPEWENVCANKVWSGWYPIATATPPTEINLSLKTGYVKAAGYKCCFSKAQNGLVVLHLAVGRESGSISAGSQICAVIPVGYRPSEAVGNSTADRSITVSPNGDVSYGTTTATPTLTFTLAFYAL